MSEPAVLAGALILRLVLGVLFIVWGSSKLRNLGEFRTALRRYRLVPGWAVPGVAVAIAVLETTSGALLLTGAATAFAVLAGIVLLATFTVAMAINLRRGRVIPCGCTAGSDAPISLAAVTRNVALIGCASALLVTDQGYGATADTLSVGDTIVAVAMVPTLVVASGIAVELVRLRRIGGVKTSRAAQ